MKLSCRRENSHRTALYRTVQKACRTLNRLGVNHEFDRQTDRWRDRQSKAIATDYKEENRTKSSTTLTQLAQKTTEFGDITKN